VAIIGKDAKNVSRECALYFVLGHSTGNDVSSRLKDLRKLPVLSLGNLNTSQN